ncbi:MAG: 2-polyprenyl-3-methyl-6-methoxy-1,4-benzoquinone monooxygenase [Gammaproteobacteria bacterium]|nr:2-polyprenyl-3-methyl-6-methoxy-1,4-benzoquinone monooxygenase [Gammaproteobacteria bacterium]
MKNIRTVSAVDQVVGNLDQALRLLFGPAPHATRANPAAALAENNLDTSERELTGRLMRVNHSGEICAQALYQGQALTARRAEIRGKMEQSAAEENDHLAWTEMRINELGGHTSYLNPLWYTGSLTIGAIAGLAGDRWSLGFLAETERQVVQHLEGHLDRLPATDNKSRAIIEQMRADESRHATVAVDAGAAELPTVVKKLMRLTAKVMTTTAYRI